MGQIVGAALVSHVPPLVMSEADRRAMNGGEDFTLLKALEDIRRDKLDQLEADTIVVFDTHWFTTIEHIITSHQHRTGLFTSEELPRGMRQMPYEIVGDPQLANSLASLSEGRDDTWITAIDDPHLPIHYPTINLLPSLQREEAWVSVGVCQTGQPADFLLLGQLLREAITGVDRRVILLASGGLSHRFWPLREFRDHEGSGLEHIRTEEARVADQTVIAMLLAGDHQAVLEYMPEFSTHAPEGRFGHYLMMLGALGGSECTLPGTQYGDYEAVAGTGQVNIWFDIE
ncbi:MAG: hypothetical protein V3V01_19820 [Acidimicrobiales bacterium]